MELRLGYRESGPSYRGFVRRDRLYSWGESIGVGGGTAWSRSAFPAAGGGRTLQSRSGGRWVGDVLVFADPVTGETVRVEANRDGLYPLRARRRPSVVEWVAVFPDWPAGPLDGVDHRLAARHPTAEGLASQEPPARRRPPPRSRCRVRVGGGVAPGRDGRCRERLAFLLAYHPRPAEAAAAVPLLADLLESARIAICDSATSRQWASWPGEHRAWSVRSRRGSKPLTPPRPTRPPATRSLTALQACGVLRSTASLSICHALPTQSTAPICRWSAAGVRFPRAEAEHLLGVARRLVRRRHCHPSGVRRPRTLRGLGSRTRRGPTPRDHRAGRPNKWVESLALKD